MKLIKNIALFAVLVFSMISCIEKTPEYGDFQGKDVDFTYNVDGDDYTLDFYVVSTIQFKNTSTKSGSVKWDFGDGTTSTENNPKHLYDIAGLYKVTLTIDGVGSRTYPLLVYDIAPILSVAKQSQEPLVINDATVEMNISLPNPDNKICKYTWIFPEGTKREDNGNWIDITTWTGYSHEDGTIDYPGKLKFKNIGSQKIEIQTIFDYQGAKERRLEDSYANVQVGCNYPCPTLYYAVMGGNIKAYKLVDPTKVPEGTKVGAFDMGVSAGAMPTQLVYANYDDQDYIYILDCGKQYTYTNDENSVNGDGKITVMTSDASDVNVMVTNVGRQAFNDPFQGCAYDGKLYYTDRGTGIRELSLKARGEVEQSDSKSETGYLVTNQQLGYYGRGIAYGSIHTGILRDKSGVFYWTKNYSGNGIYRFTTADIGQLKEAPTQILLPGANPRAFMIDEDRNKMYVWMSKGNIGFNEFNLPDYKGTVGTKDYTKFISMDADPVNTTTDEGVFVTQFVVDSETGNVYFGFNASSTEKTYKTGIKYYDITTKSIKSLNNNNEKVLGVTICKTPTILF